MALVALAASSAAVDIPSDWDITGHTPLSSDTMNVYGNITVKSGGWLELTSIDMVIKATVDGQYTLKVDAGGRLTFIGGTIKAEDPSLRYKVVIRGRATLEGLTITDTWGSGVAFNADSGAHPDLSGYYGGVQIYSDNVYVGNCTLKEGLLCMIYVYDASPTLYGNTFEDIVYLVQYYSQTTGGTSNTKWSAMAFGVLLDIAPANLDSNTFTRVGDFTTLEAVYYRDSPVNNNEYQVIAAAVAARGGQPHIESSTITDTGVLTRTFQMFTDGGNNVNQSFMQYRVAGIYAFEAVGSNLKTNTVSTSVYGMFIIVSPSASGGPMTFDVIIDNILQRNSMGGIYFEVRSVKRTCTINVTDDDMEDNGEGGITGLEDNGLVIFASDCTGDLTIILGRDNFRRNRARGALIDVHSHSGDLSIVMTDTNSFTDNQGSGLAVSLDTVSGDVDVLITNTTLTGNNPQATGDEGAIGLQGSAITAGLAIKLSDVVASSNTGNGLGINMGGVMAVNLATSTSYTIHRCWFNSNTQHGIYIFDSYGANAQNTVYDLVDVTASDDRFAMYIHSNSQLGNINFRIMGFLSADSSSTEVAVRIELAAATFNPRALLSDLRIYYTTGGAPAATGLALQGPEANKRWNLDLKDSYITRPGTSLDAMFCNVDATNCNLTGEGVNSVVARDSMVKLYFCRIPDLSATVTSTVVNVGVKYYKYLNITLVAWQNREPIFNQTISIRRFREPKDEIFSHKTDQWGNLSHKLVPFWEKDGNNNPLRNDELQAFLTIRGDTINSLSFDFNVSVVGIEDPTVPELVISTPTEGTVQKAGAMVIHGEIRDSHSGIKAVELTLDNVVWYNITDLVTKVGRGRAVFDWTIPGLSDGLYTLTIRGWDVARWQNESFGVALLTIKNIKIDTEPPFLQMLSPTEPFHVTNRPFFDIVGQTERATSIRRLTINDMPLPIIGVTFTYNASLYEGTNTYVIIAEDTAGNIAVATRQIVLDTQEPTLIITSPFDGFSSKEQDFEVSGDTEERATVYIQLDDRAEKEVVERGGTRFYFIQNIKVEGIHKLTISAVDIAGNTNTQVIHVKHDVTPPVLEDIIPTRDSKPTNIQRVYVGGRTDPEVKQVTVNGLIFPVHSGDFALEINLLEGEQTLTIWVQDAAKNENSTTFNIFIDVTPPILESLTVGSTEPGSEPQDLYDGLVINKRIVRFTAALAEADAREIWIQVGSDNRTALVDDPAINSYYRDFNLDEGENLVSVYIIDIAGNKVVYLYRMVVDPRPPTIKYYNPKMTQSGEATVDTDTVLISGVIEEKGVTLMIANRNVAVRPDTGSFQINVPLDEGPNNIEVLIIDRAGNTASDVLHITYRPKGEDEMSVADTLANLWWVFAIVIGLAILVPLTVHRTRDTWVQEHPELEDYDSKKYREGLYEYVDDGYDDYQYDDHQEGGRY